MEINYMAHLKGFRIMRAINPIGANEICLYYILCEYNNELRFPEWFTAANSTIQGLTGLSIRALKEARNALIQKKYIKYKKGNGNQSGSYHILDFSYLVTNYVPQTVPQCIPQTVPQDVPQTSSNPDTLNKLNKTKRNETRDISAREEEKRKWIDYQRVADMYNETCVSFPRCTKISESRKKAIKARLNSGYTYDDFKNLFEKAENSRFLKGGNDRNWKADFDWLLKDSNIAKVLDGRYDDSGSAPPKPSKFNNFSEQEEYDFDRLEKAAMAKLLEEAGT